MDEVLNKHMPNTEIGCVMNFDGVVIQTKKLNGLYQIAGWNDFQDAAKQFLRKIGLTSLGNYRNTQVCSDIRAWRTAPDKMLIEGIMDTNVSSSDDFAVLDLSSSRLVINLSGERVRTILMKLIGIDLSCEAFKVNEFIQTGIHGVGVLIHCIDDDSFDILVPITWYQSVWDIISTNSRYGG